MSSSFRHRLLIVQYRGRGCVHGLLQRSDMVAAMILHCAISVQRTRGLPNARLRLVSSLSGRQRSKARDADTPGLISRRCLLTEAQCGLVQLLSLHKLGTPSTVSVGRLTSSEAIFLDFIILQAMRMNEFKFCSRTCSFRWFLHCSSCVPVLTSTWLSQLADGPSSSSDLGIPISHRVPNSKDQRCPLRVAVPCLYI